MPPVRRQFVYLAAFLVGMLRAVPVIGPVVGRIVDRVRGVKSGSNDKEDT